jgi:uncharacterized cupin superfamily protein
MEEAPDGGRRPASDGWFVLNATKAPWVTYPGFGTACSWESPEHRFAQLGINVQVLGPGEPNAMYHGENLQEDFLVLWGECVLVIEGEERRLRAWDFVHCPPWTRHVFIGAGQGPCAIVMIGARDPAEEIEYPVEPVATRYGAGVDRATADPGEAYSRLEQPTLGPYEPGTLRP